MGQSSGTKKYNASRRAKGRLAVEAWVKLKARNWSNAEIARRCGVSESAVGQGLSRYYETRPIPGAEEVRAQETVKLDIRERRVTAALLEHIGDVEAHARFDRRLQEIAERRAKLLGLDTPVAEKINLEVTAGIASPAKAREAMRSAFGGIGPADGSDAGDDPQGLGADAEQRARSPHPGEEPPKV